MNRRNCFASVLAFVGRVALAVAASVYGLHAVAADAIALDVSSRETLRIPALTAGSPTAGKRVAVTPPEIAGTKVFHTVHLPETWSKDGPALPIIFEYTGNHFPKSGSTGKVEDAALGYGLSGGKFIWVSLPYVSADGTSNAVTWWGDVAATVTYAKLNVPRIIRKFGADTNAVFLCGFSRGAIGVNFIGLHDDEIAALWSAFFAHDHFDGAREWRGTDWGSPLEAYQADAAQRLRRVGGRPYFVSQNGNGRASESFIRSVLSAPTMFQFGHVDTAAVLGAFPNEHAVAAHTDRWAIQPSAYRESVWAWVNRVIDARTGGFGELIFSDDFERSESQELTDEPGNGWTTSSDKTAGGRKQVDLRDGAMHMHTAEGANHAVSTRHEFAFADGTIGMRFKLDGATDQLQLNFADMELKSVWAGHLFDVVFSADGVAFEDKKTGVMDLKIRAARQAGKLPPPQAAELAAKKKTFKHPKATGQWHDLLVHVDGDSITALVDGVEAGRFRSPGFVHPTKRLLRLLVPGQAAVDEVRIWRRR